MVLGSDAYRVLVIEDTPDHAALIQIVFSHSDPDARIRVTRSAEEAMAFLEKCHRDTDLRASERPDIMILDIHMPGLGGLRFLEWCLTEPAAARIPVVVLTAGEDRSLARRCFQLGAREFLQKPSDFSELVPAIQRILGRNQSTDAAEHA